VKFTSSTASAGADGCGKDDDADFGNLDSDGTCEGTRTAATVVSHMRSNDTLQSLNIDRSTMAELQRVWQPGHVSSNGKSRTRYGKSKAFKQENLLLIEMTTGTTMLLGGDDSSFFKHLIVRPSSNVRLFWDLLTLVMVAYDVVTIPLLAFNLDGKATITVTMDWSTLIFWTFDMPVSFMTGFHVGGIVEMRPFAIAKNYMKSWFAMDITIVLMDWFFKALSFGDKDAVGIFRYGKAGRISRLLRAVRLLRFMKLQRTLTEFLELIQSEYMSTLCNVGLTILFIVTLNHYIACGWYFMGSWFLDSGHINWVSENNMKHQPLSYRYTTSLHWSLTQFTPASMEIRPYNVGERTYSIVVLLFALITFSSFLGSITNAMTQLRQRRSEQAKQQALLRKYFGDNQISIELGQRIWKFIKNTHFAQRSRLRTSDVLILSKLSSSLSKSLNEELYRPYLTRVPVLQHYMNLEMDGHAEICHKSVIEQSLIAGDDVFVAGAEGEKIYILASGSMSYKLDQTLAAPQKVKLGWWVSEASLWLQWTHGGRLSATTSCECFAVIASSCREVMCKYVPSMSFLQAYAAHFHELVANVDDSCWGSDLHNDVDDLDEVIRQAYDDIEQVHGEDQEESEEGWGFGRLMSMQLGAKTLRKRISRQSARLSTRLSFRV